MRNLHPGKPLGFTLLELIFTLAVLAVLVSIGTPALGSLIHSAHSRSARTALIGSLNLARISAASLHRTLLVCPSRDHANCDDNPWWHDGWIVFEDKNQNSRRDDNDSLLEVVGSQPGMVIATNTGRRYVRYRPDGSASGTDLTYTL